MIADHFNLFGNVADEYSFLILLKQLGRSLVEKVSNQHEIAPKELNCHFFYKVFYILGPDHQRSNFSAAALK